MFGWLLLFLFLFAGGLSVDISFSLGAQIGIVLFKVLFVTVYVFEASAKIWSAPYSFFASSWNIFDFVITVLCAIGVFIQFVLVPFGSGEEDSSSSIHADHFAFSVGAAFESILLLRCLHVIVNWTKERDDPAFYKRFLALRSTIYSLSHLIFWMVMAIFCIIYSCACVGIDLFGCGVMSQADAWGTPFANFDSLPFALLALYQLLASSNWSSVNRFLFANLI